MLFFLATCVIFVNVINYLLYFFYLCTIYVQGLNQQEMEKNVTHYLCQNYSYILNITFKIG